MIKNGLIKIGNIFLNELIPLNLNKEIRLIRFSTVLYIASEIIQDHSYDNKSDIWSVGCIIYQLCTYTPPFICSSLLEIYHNITKGYYSPIPYSFFHEMKEIIKQILVTYPIKGYQ